MVLQEMQWCKDKFVQDKHVSLSAEVVCVHTLLLKQTILIDITNGSGIDLGKLMLSMDYGTDLAMMG